MLRVEIDCDGVLLNIIKTVYQSDNYGKKLTRLGASFEEPKFWNFQDVPKEVREVIFAAFEDPEIQGNTELYAYTRDFLTDLIRGISSDVKVVLHTVSPEICVEARKLCLKRLLLSLDRSVANRIDVQVDEGVKVMLHNSAVLIEDSPKNVLNSNAAYKILIDHPYNQDSSYPELQSINYYRAVCIDDVLNYIFASLDKCRANKLKNLDLTSELLYTIGSSL